MELTGDSIIDVYKEYSQTFDNQLLVEFEPIDVFQMYMYAASVNDFQTMYALYAKDESTSIPNEVEYIEEQKGIEGNNFLELYEDLVRAESFIQYEDVETATIRYKIPNDYRISFLLIKDQDEGIWEVQFDPIS